MVKLYETPVKAIRKKCLDYSYWSPKEVRECTITNCQLSLSFCSRPNKAVVDTLKRFYGDNVEPNAGL
jgi:hypothetical protein